MEEVKGEDLLKRHYPKVDVWKGLALEGLANRDAMPYADKYGLGEVDGLTNLFRGTLRSVLELSQLGVNGNKADGVQVSRFLALARIVQTDGAAQS